MSMNPPNPQDGAEPGDHPAAAAGPLSVAVRASRRLAVAWAALMVVGVALNLVGVLAAGMPADGARAMELAGLSPGEIWCAASAGSRPVLYYWAMHLVFSALGPSVVACRLVSLAGLCALAALGWTHVRRDVGPKTCLGYTFVVLFAPWSLAESVDVGAFTWAAFFAMLCLLSCVRLARRALDGSPAPAGLWAAALLSAVACAYLHLFSVISATLSLILVLVALLAAALGRRGPAGVALRGLATFVVGALACLAACSPRLSAALGAAGVRGASAGAAAGTGIAERLLGVALFPAYDDAVASLALGGGGLAWQVACASALSLLAAASLAAAVLAGRNSCAPLFGREQEAPGGRGARALGRVASLLSSPPIAAGLVYVAMAAVALVVSLTAGPGYAGRCLFAGIGPLALGLSTVFVRSRRPLVAQLAVASLLVLALCGRWWDLRVPAGDVADEAVRYEAVVDGGDAAAAAGTDVG